MAAAVAFQQALPQLGFTQESSAALGANGLTSTEDLIDLTDKDVEQILKIIRTGPPPVAAPYLAQKQLNTFCFWAKRRNQLGEPINAALFTP
jgi:hypothetical protein